MKKVIVLGCGMVGSAMAIDLSKNFAITSADISESNLKSVAGYKNIGTIQVDLSKFSEITSLVSEYDFVVSAVPGFLGYKVLEAIINAKKNVVDISFMPEDTLALHKLAVEKGVTAITDCGVAPGMPNLIVGYHNERFRITDFEYMVGGLPKVRTFPFEYKAPFSPIDVIEEYSRPARYVENGHQVVKPPMSDAEIINFEQVGSLEAFNTDGLRSLIFTLPNIPNMKEKTLRYPNHIKLIQMLQTAGFFETKEIEISKTKIRPIDFTTKILFSNWKLQPEEPEFTVMRVKIRGIENNKQKTIVYDLYDEYNTDTKTSSMARTTGYTATAALNMMAEGLFTKKGVFPPELVGKYSQCFEYMINYLKDRNINYRYSEF